MATMLFIKKIVQIIFIIAPILLILLLTIDFSKAVIEGSEDRINHIKSVAIKRILFAILLFFVPLIVDVSFSLLDSSKTKVIDCYNNASDENVERLVSGYELDVKNKEESNQTKTEQIRQKQKEEAEKRKKLAASSISSNNSTSPSNICTNCSASEKIAQTAETLAWPYGTDKKIYKHSYGARRFSSWSELDTARPTQAFMDAYDKARPGHWKLSQKYPFTRIGASCDVFVGVVIKTAGYGYVGYSHPAQNSFFKNKDKYERISYNNIQRGDICDKCAGGHVMIYVGNGKVAHAGYSSRWFGHIGKETNCSKCGAIYRIKEKK